MAALASSVYLSLGYTYRGKVFSWIDILSQRMDVRCWGESGQLCPP
jgi:hypothetical protein